MRIIGYKDLRGLKNLGEFNSLKYVPHLCISRTLCDGILNYYGRDEFTILTTTDRFIKTYFKDWVNGKDDTRRFIYLSEIIDSVEDYKIRESFRKSKKALFRTIKTLLECDVSLSEISSKNNEEKAFLDIYNKVITDDRFNTNILKNKEKVHFNIALEEIINEENLEKGIMEDLKGIDKVVLHGIHKFTPLLLKLIESLEKNNIEVIFLINYNENFENIYSTWNRVYKWTGLEIEKDKALDIYSHNIISENYGNILEGNLEDLDLESEINIKRFKNYVDLTNYIINNSNGNEVYFSAEANKINDILKNYFPERFQEKSFLAYLEGQYIGKIFSMVDDLENEIKVKVDDLEECLYAGYLEFDIEVFNKVKPYYKDLDEKSITKYIERTEGLIKKLKLIEESSEKSKRDYKRISYFSITIEEAVKLKENLEEIQKVIVILRDGETNLLKKYKEIVKEVSGNIEEQDIENFMIKDVIDTLKKSTELEYSEKFKEAMKFYLRKEREDDNKLMVRDFNHIEGGTLDSEKTYHFMEVSDSSIQKREKNIVWPLDIEIIRRKNKNIDIVKKSLEEGANYLKYALFYGLYSTENNIKVSYVEKKNNNKEELYYIFKLMKVKIEENYNIKKEEYKVKEKSLKFKSFDNEEDEKRFNFCYFRYVNESLMDENGVYSEDFLIKAYLKNLPELFLKNAKEKIKWIAPQLSEAECDALNKEYTKERDLNKIEEAKEYRNCKYKNICLKTCHFKFNR